MRQNSALYSPLCLWVVIPRQGWGEVLSGPDVFLHFLLVMKTESGEGSELLGHHGTLFHENS